MEGLLLAQGFDAAGTPSGVEFAFVNAKSRRKTHESRADESTGEPEAQEEQQAPQHEAKQIRGCIGCGHSYPRRKRFASLSGRLGDRLDL